MMSAKEYLQQIYWLQVCIEQKIEEAESLEHMAMNPGSPAAQPDKVSGSGTGDRIARIVEKYTTLQEEVRRQQETMATLRHKIIDQVQKLKDATYIQILYRHYVKMEPFTKIAYEMGYNYKWLCELHGRALDAFEEEVLKELDTTGIEV